LDTARISKKKLAGNQKAKTALGHKRPRRQGSHRLKFSALRNCTSELRT
jgi:hypothetical protein